MPYAIAKETFTEEPYEFKSEEFAKIALFYWFTIEKAKDGTTKVLDTQLA